MDGNFTMCDICHEFIYNDEERYEMPDGKTVCTNPDCLQEWADEYKKLGDVW